MSSEDGAPPPSPHPRDAVVVKATVEVSLRFDPVQWRTPDGRFVITRVPAVGFKAVGWDFEVRVNDDRQTLSFSSLEAAMGWCVARKAG
jgi:hypothetical protein